VLTVRPNGLGQAFIATSLPYFKENLPGSYSSCSPGHRATFDNLSIALSLFLFGTIDGRHPAIAR
jgi:hypothetical protein